TLPAGLTNGVASGSGWTCSGSSPVACTRSSVLNAGASYPIIVVTVDVTSTAPPSVSNTATVSGGGEVNTANDSSTDVTAIVQAADLTVTQSQQPSAFSLGQTGAQLLFTVNNVGPGPTTGFVTFSTVLGGTGFTPTALAGTGWTCDVPT